MDKISFIIVHYNTYELTRSCVHSILQSPGIDDLEIIIVDNDSTEPIPIPFAELSDAVHYVRSESNLGFAKGNNLGLRYATGKYICLINSDARVEHVDWPRLALKSDEADISFVTCKMTYPDGKIQNNCQSFPNAGLHILERSRLHLLLPKRLRSRIYQGFYFDHDRSAPVDWAWGAFLFFRRDLLKIYENEILPDRYFMYGEDLLWGYLANQHGMTSWYSAEDHVIHEVGKSKGRRNEQLDKNMKDFLLEYYPRWHARLLLLF